MTPESAVVAAAAIGGVTSLGVAVVGVIGARAHRTTREALAVNTGKTDEVLHQVKNDHDTNLRDDLDQLAELVAAHTVGLGAVSATQTRVASMVGNLNRDARKFASQLREHEVASALIVDELHKADRALWAEILHHHPKTART